MSYRDMRRTVLEEGDLVCGSFREDTVSVLRTGIVQKLGYTHDPQVESPPETPVSVAWVLWTDTTGRFLPKKMTRVATRKLCRVDS